VFPGEVQRIPVDGGAVELVPDGLDRVELLPGRNDRAIYFSQGGRRALALAADAEPLRRRQPRFDPCALRPARDRVFRASEAQALAYSHRLRQPRVAGVAPSATVIALNTSSGA
jgi:hypothetical protein